MRKYFSYSIERFERLGLASAEEQFRQQQRSTNVNIKGNESGGGSTRPEKIKDDLDTGIFKTLPVIFTGPTHFKRATRALKQIRVDNTMKNMRNRNRKYTAESIDAVMKGLTKPITNALDSYNNMLSDLHPYEAAVADLTIIARVKTGNPSLKDTLERLKQLRALTSRTAKEYAALASICVSAVEAKELLATGMAELERIYKEAEDATALDDLIAIQKDLRRIPVIDLDLPTVVLVGAPNVGKSSIVRAVSTGTPEVNDYPFTTRGVTIGHILGTTDDFASSKEIRFQVMDTPGLLDRPEEERNEMERLTFASLAHLPTAVMFVIDPTGLSGEKSTFQAQLNVRNYLKSRFPKRPWLDVVSKGDIPISPEVEAMLPEGHLSVSVMSGKNIDVLKTNVEETLYRLRAMLIERKRAEEEQRRSQALAESQKKP